MINTVLGVALAEEGYLEKHSNFQLDDKKANVGKNNYTKYWRDLAPGYQGQPWCNAFVNWVFAKSFGEEKAKGILCTKGNWSYYTPTSASYFKSEGRWYNTPNVGDIIYFKNSTRICHVGIVIDVDNTYVYTIEGNTGNGNEVVANGGGVFRKKYLLTNQNIAGYGRPKYNVSTPQTSVSTPQTTLNKEPKFYGKVNAGKLNVRKGAGTNYANLVSYPHIHKDDKIGICDEQKAVNGDTWYYIQIEGNQGTKYGFVNSKYITKIQESTNTSIYVANSRDTSLTGTYIVTASILNMRKGSSTNTDIVKKLPKNTKVQCYGYYSMVDNKRWLYVTDNKDTGFCSENYLKKL